MATVNAFDGRAMWLLAGNSTVWVNGGIFVASTPPLVLTGVDDVKTSGVLVVTPVIHTDRTERVFGIETVAPVVQLNTKRIVVGIALGTPGNTQPSSGRIPLFKVPDEVTEIHYPLPPLLLTG